MSYIELYQAKYILKLLKKGVSYPKKIGEKLIRSIEDDIERYDRVSSCGHSNVQEFTGVKHVCSECGQVMDVEWNLKSSA